MGNMFEIATCNPKHCALETFGIVYMGREWAPDSTHSSMYICQIAHEYNVQNAYMKVANKQTPLWVTCVNKFHSWFV